MRKSKRDAKRSMILDRSFQLLKKNGYGNTTVDDLSKACSITKPTFYQYVHTKDELLSQFYEMTFEQVDHLANDLYNQEKYVECLWVALCGIHHTMISLGEEMFLYYVRSLLDKDYLSYRFKESLYRTCLYAIEKLKKNNLIEVRLENEQLYKLLVHLDQGLICRWIGQQLEGNITDCFRGAFISVLQLSNPQFYDLNEVHFEKGGE